MGDKSSIEWTDATWNPVRGCSIVSKGCTNCYAMKQAHRSSGAGGAYEGLTKLTKGGPVWTGEVRELEELLDLPLKWKRPRRIFVNSMSDLFHEAVRDEFILQIFGVMAIATQHTFQVLTKRPARMAQLLNAGGYFTAKGGFPPSNVWLGVSVEDQATADERIPLLLQTPATVRWISAEPLLGPIVLKDPPNDIGEPRLSYLERVDLADPESPRIDWVVAGGESGPGARPMHPSWPRSLRDQCKHAGVPFFFKQWGSWRMAYGSTEGRRCAVSIDHGITLDMAPGTQLGNLESFNGFMYPMQHVGKKTAGRQLDGRTHDEYPTSVR